MRFLMYRFDDESVPIPRLTPEQAEEMGKVTAEATKAGVLVFNGGIAPTAMGSKITRANGEITVTDGPFTEAKELVGGWALLETRDKDEAIEWAKRLQNAAGDGEMRIRQVW
ncbi:MAG: YciI family protein [Acidimicrobiia bacterium]